MRRASIALLVSATWLVAACGGGTGIGTPGNNNNAVPEDCGNDQRDPGEECDGADLNGGDCASIAGHSDGALACAADCTYDVSSCGELLVYLDQGFEDPSSLSNWVFGGDWERGTPSAADAPTAAHGGLNVIGTNMGGNYSGSNAYLTDLAESPSIDLTSAYAPALRFYMWVDTESGWDCGTLFISVGGGSWSHVASVLPAHNGSEGGYACWEGTSISSWQEVNVDLSTYVGQSIRLGFGFYSDSLYNYSGWYIDDVIVAEPNALP